MALHTIRLPSVTAERSIPLNTYREMISAASRESDWHRLGAWWKLESDASRTAREFLEQILKSRAEVEALCEDSAIEPCHLAWHKCVSSSKP